jgi:hypothetical protein
MLDLLSRLPDAQLKGATGYGLNEPEVQGRPDPTNAPGAPPSVDETIHPLSGQPENNRGLTLLLPPPFPIAPLAVKTETGFRSIIEMRSRGSDAELMSVSLDLELGGGLDNNQTIPNPFGGNQSFVRALLSWGIGGASFSAMCDWLQGTQLAIAANYIRINAQYVNLSDGITLSPPFLISAGLSYGNVGRASQPARFTEMINLQAGATSPVMKIPKYATSFCVTANSPATISLLNFGNASGTLGYTFTPAMSNVNQRNNETDFPLFNGARFYTVTNNGAAADAFGMIFALAL